MNFDRKRRRRIDGPLTRTALAAGAVELVRAEGLTAVTMRAVAARLGTAPMTLYRHVGDRRELLIEMLGLVADNVVLPADCSDPRAAVIDVFGAIHDALEADPWAVELIVGERLASPRILPAVEMIFSALAATGLDDEQVAHAYAVLWQFTVGEVFDNHGRSPEDYREAMVRDADPQAYPALVAMVSRSVPEPPDRYRESVALILDAVIAQGLPTDGLPRTAH